MGVTDAYQSLPELNQAGILLSDLCRIPELVEVNRTAPWPKLLLTQRYKVKVRFLIELIVL